MAHYIDKDDLVAEIERLKDNAHNGVSYHQSRQNVGLNNELSTWEHLESAFATILKIIETLEVKEVDLEEEIQRQYNVHKNPNNSIVKDCVIMTKDGFEYFAKHFFELGMSVSNKAQKK